MSPGLFTLTLVAALGCVAMAGVFFAFSAFVMGGLARLPPAQGIAPSSRSTSPTVDPNREGAASHWLGH